ncbi:antibiotic biosynthesis monooxygenase family protein [Lentibacter sp. XHP0401]|uniref:antibiotic biosynthesis monooxygenase family protein n=1 Tax=Lentibacter sp. XHP0401 TaxID=2984334 RepID=UPI0021E807A0|nr:antibiotic biosynthesis monooxygenase [Lentibacter sp. XHP0401]MCV2894530.1 antibiotic biosynthesis monooxygenase [Lentibacter sp. XHP0401]
MSYIAMNRFRVALGREDDFEAIWKNREGRLSEMKGFREFRLLKGPTADDHQLYSSHTLWESKDDFDAWTKSQQFRDAHKNAGNGRTEGVMVGHPQFEGFETVLIET